MAKALKAMRDAQSEAPQQAVQQIGLSFFFWGVGKGSRFVTYFFLEREFYNPPDPPPLASLRAGVGRGCVSRVTTSPNSL